MIGSVLMVRSGEAGMTAKGNINKKFEHRLKNCLDFANTTVDFEDEILAMLKKQEPTMVIESENMYTGLPITHCPKCGKSLDRYLYGRRQEGEINFCPYCGQAVTWE